jgi:hypothetical protein
MLSIHLCFETFIVSWCSSSKHLLWPVLRMVTWGPKTWGIWNTKEIYISQSTSIDGGTPKSSSRHGWLDDHLSMKTRGDLGIPQGLRNHHIDMENAPCRSCPDGQTNYMSISESVCWWYLISLHWLKGKSTGNDYSFLSKYSFRVQFFLQQVQRLRNQLIGSPAHWSGKKRIEIAPKSSLHSPPDLKKSDRFGVPMLISHYWSSLIIINHY